MRIIGCINLNYRKYKFEPWEVFSIRWHLDMGE